MKILLIDDDELNQKLTRTLLETEGYTVLQALDAESGLKMTREHLPDLILMDIELPNMDGLSATRIIKNDPDITHIPIVALTASAMVGDEPKAIDAGCSGYITKPFDIYTLVNSIRNVLRTHSGEMKN